jgi:NAD(P)-dependent dehydrogenase (short-subunit alcohol dehydrogenase family)
VPLNGLKPKKITSSQHDRFEYLHTFNKGAKKTEMAPALREKHPRSWQPDAKRNVVNPPVIDEKALSMEEAEKLTDARFPVGRPATGGDIAEAVMVFASDQASFITGQVLNVSGGWMP